MVAANDLPLQKTQFGDSHASSSLRPFVCSAGELAYGQLVV
ncbi:hypothetical protein RMSM_05610 [Rhodopirellula maiorica SM1]|uniref:Uncharacterized protein n=1 Tax=Rhodopirellula maiorica SM1 TaxID=1265738 RepID=M5RQ00_9BACT|nr:hypothetical protein RMSM_05610 [Rhodopirellula maiorica SM1]